MPFKSKAQKGYLYVHHPTVAKKFQADTSKKQEAKLPEHVKKSPKKK
ncbi:MAG: hypothetical protein WC551_07600 [Patescibacteria group bacterium]